MGGRASLIMVIGFALIFGIINLNIARLTNSSVSRMVGYNESSTSRTVGNAAANIGLALLADNFFLGRGELLNKDYTSGPYKNCGFTIRMDSIYTNPTRPYLRLRCAARCTTFLKDESSHAVVIRDTVEIRFDCTRMKSFSSLGWMSVTEGNVFFITGDTLWGDIHSNGNIHCSGRPVFDGRVTTSGRFDPNISTKKKTTDNKAIFLHYTPETGVPEKPFPSDLSEVIAAANNTLHSTLTSPPVNSRTRELYVELIPGGSGNNDGYALIYTAVPCTSTVSSTTYDWWGHPTTTTREVIFSVRDTLLESLNLSDATNTVIYSSENVHVEGILDGRLTVSSGKDVVLENDVVYEKRPDPTKPLSDPVNETKDMLGLVARSDVIVSDNVENHDNDLNVDASIFALDGSFTAENYNGRGVEGRINLVGSVAQNTRGAVGNFSGSTIKNGYSKSYHYDNRMNDPDKPNDESTHPPSFPGFASPGPLKVLSWWESNRIPFDVDKYQ